MRVIAMYLPQFHRVRENEEWWGEGFTDWMAVKNAKPLFEGHYQPHIPLGNYYYDLLKKETLLWQAGLMKKYEVDGMCFFHYWFQGGRRILEKPAEILLENDEIEMPFCFCWANESWSRTWKAISGTNTWMVSDADISDNETKPALLLAQDYGSEKDWEEHFQYLLPFFRDRRYVHIEGKPIFLFYEAGQIYCLGEMLSYWQKLARRNGLKGLYIMAARLNGKQVGGVDAEFLSEPSKFQGNVKETIRNGVSTYSYDSMWQFILQKRGTYERQYFCGLVSYDTVPRKKKYGICVDGVSPEKFGIYMKALFRKSEEAGSDVVFVNAWNEWGEGNHLEPDKKYGYEWLKQLKAAKEQYRESFISQQTELSVRNLLRSSNKFETYLNFMDKWMCLRESGVSLKQILHQRNINTVLIYGYGIIGKHLLWELSDMVVGVIDQKNVLVAGMDTYTPKMSMPNADAVVVASFYFWDEIKKALKKNRTVRNIVSFEEIMSWAYADSGFDSDRG